MPATGEEAINWNGKFHGGERGELVGCPCIKVARTVQRERLSSEGGKAIGTRLNGPFEAGTYCCVRTCEQATENDAKV